MQRLLFATLLLSTPLVAAPFVNPPEFQPEERADTPRHQRLNVIDFGAKADGQSHPLSESFASQEEIDRKYGPDRYTLKDEADFVAIMEAIRTAQAAGEALAKPKLVRYTSRVYLPAGIYVINRTIPFIDTYGGGISGDGRQQTVLRFHAPEALFTITRCAFLSFEGFSIESSVASRSTGFRIIDACHEIDGKPTFNLTFDSLIFQFLYKAVHIEGVMMTDSMVFSRIRFLNCLTSFHLQNPQGLNYQFIGCNFEALGGEKVFAPFSPEEVVCFHIEAGGALSVFGGSIIHEGVTLKLEPTQAFAPDRLDGGNSPSISVGSGFYNFYGTRWEQKGGNQPILFDATDDGRYQARINFDNCMVYQMNAARGKTVGVLHSGMNVTMRNTVFNYGAIIAADEPPTEKRRGVLILDNTSGLTHPFSVEEKTGPVHLVEERGPRWP